MALLCEGGRVWSSVRGSEGLIDESDIDRATWLDACATRKKKSNVKTRSIETRRERNKLTDSGWLALAGGWRRTVGEDEDA